MHKKIEETNEILRKHDLFYRILNFPSLNHASVIGSFDRILNFRQLIRETNHNTEKRLTEKLEVQENLIKLRVEDTEIIIT